MKWSHQIKPISYIKAHAAEIIRNLAKKHKPLIITQNGEAKAVIQDIESYEKKEELLDLLRLLAIGNKQIDNKEVEPAKKVFERIRRQNQS